FASTLPATLAAQAATKEIPIVFVTGADPIENRLVESLSRPGGNVTGIVNLNILLAAKRLEVLHELVPAAPLYAHLVNLASPFAESETREVSAAARGLGVRLLTLNATFPDDFEPAFAMIREQRAGALLVGGDNLFQDRSDRLIALAARNALPAIYAYKRS